MATVSCLGPDGFVGERRAHLDPPDFDTRTLVTSLVLSIHGGPMNTSTEAFSTFNQIMAAQGWLLFSPDYRGPKARGLQDLREQGRFPIAWGREVVTDAVLGRQEPAEQGEVGGAC